jgi:hypothetical protein
MDQQPTSTTRGFSLRSIAKRVSRSSSSSSSNNNNKKKASTSASSQLQHTGTAEPPLIRCDPEVSLSLILLMESLERTKPETIDDQKVNRAAVHEIWL